MGTYLVLMRLMRIVIKHGFFGAISKLLYFNVFTCLYAATGAWNTIFVMQFKNITTWTGIGTAIANTQVVGY